MSGGPCAVRSRTGRLQRQTEGDTLPQTLLLRSLETAPDTVSFPPLGRAGRLGLSLAVGQIESNLGLPLWDR